MARTTNGLVAERKWNEKFPDKELLTFSRVTKPVKIRCPIHGVVESKSYRSALASKHGCPECGKDHTLTAIRSALAESRTKTKRIIESNLKSLGEFALWSASQPLPEDGYVYVPFYKDIKFAAGHGSFEQEDYNGYKLPFAKSTLWRHGISPNNAACFEVTGDSMEPRFFHGASIGVDRGQTDIKDGDVYAFLYDGTLRVKILYKSGDYIRSISYNPAYPEERLHLSDVQIIGRVFWSSDLF